MGPIRNAWYVGAWSHKLQAGEPQALRILDEPIVLYRAASGRAVALQDRCSHRLAPLSMGRCEGESIRCMYHGLRFEPDGSCSQIPGQDLIPPQSRVRSYPVLERHGWVWVWMGAAEAADEALIVPVIGPEDGRYVLGRGDLDYQAPAMLICDNLLDFSHLAYVHASTFKATEVWGETRPVITALPRGVRVQRWVLNQPPLFTGPHTDQWFSYDFLAPAVLMLTTMTYPVGKAEAFGFGEPPAEEAWIQNSYTAHAITPMTDQTSRYFFTFGPHRDGGSEAQAQAYLDTAYAAFAEDQAFIEAQARVIAEFPQAPVMPTSADVAITMFHRLTARLASAEAAQGAQPAA